jgi:toxin ParE1/3/4
MEQIMTGIYKIIWLKKALINLDEQMEFIARENPQAAEDQFTNIEIALNHLLQHPSVGRPGRVHGTRELVVPNTSFIIPYKVKFNPTKQCNEILILRLFHASRKLPKRW